MREEVVLNGVLVVASKSRLSGRIGDRALDGSVELRGAGEFLEFGVLSFFGFQSLPATASFGVLRAEAPPTMRGAPVREEREAIFESESYSTDLSRRTYPNSPCFINLPRSKFAPLELEGPSDSGGMRCSRSCRYGSVEQSAWSKLGINQTSIKQKLRSRAQVLIEIQQTMNKADWRHQVQQTHVLNF